MPITHEWNGTILTITSDSGTSSCDLKGEKGDDGARGAQGKPGDCVATDTAMLGGVAAAEYALKTDIPSLDGYATEDFVNTAIANADIDLSGYATKTDLEDYALTTDLEPYATSFYVDNELDAVKTDLATNYALKGDTAPNAFMLGGKNAEEYALKADCFDMLAIYPVGSIYISTVSTSPAELFGGAWNRLKDRFLLGAGNSYSAGSTGGEATVKLTYDQLPSFWVQGALKDDSANQSYYADALSGTEWTTNFRQSGWVSPSSADGKYGNDEAHNNMPPYLTVYMWERVE